MAMDITFENNPSEELRAFITSTIQRITDQPHAYDQLPISYELHVRTVHNTFKAANLVFFVRGLFRTNTYVKVLRQGDAETHARFQKEISATIWAANAKIGPEVVYHDYDNSVFATRAIEAEADELGLDRVQRARLVLDKLCLLSQVGPERGPRAPVCVQNSICTTAFTGGLLDKSKLRSEDLEDFRVRESISVMDRALVEAEAFPPVQVSLSTGDSGEHNARFAPLNKGDARGNNSETPEIQAEALLIDWEEACYDEPLADIVRLAAFYTPAEQKAIDFEGWLQRHPVLARDPLALPRYRTLMRFLKAGGVLQAVVGGPWHPEDWRERSEREWAIDEAYQGLLASLECGDPWR